MSDPQNLSGAYALNALDAQERAEFESVMDGSEQLRNEVTELTDTAVELGLSVAPVDPPASLRASILDAVASTPQVPARVEERRAAPGLAEERREATGLAEERREATRLEAPASPAELKARSRWGAPLVRVGAVAASIVLIVGLAFGVRAGLQLQSDVATANQITQIQAADDSQRRTVQLEGGGSATAVWSGQLRQAALLVDDWQQLPARSTYELWFMDASGAATPAGTFDVDGNGSHSAVLEGAMDAGDSIGVTVEPAGGSDSPSDQVVLVLETA